MSKRAECWLYACRAGRCEKVLAHLPYHIIKCGCIWTDRGYRLPATAKGLVSMRSKVESRRKMGFKKLVFCPGFAKKATDALKVLKGAGFMVESVKVEPALSPSVVLNNTRRA